MKNILARILAIWALITFAVTFLIAFVFSLFSWLIPNPRGQVYFVHVGRIWMNVWHFMVGCSTRIKGKENFKKGETYIVTCNHRSLMDPTMSSAFIPGASKTIAKKSFTKVPLFGLFYSRGGVIVDRSSEKSRRQSFEKMKYVLEHGIHMGIYPEGTRNRTPDPLKSFHDGAFRLAVETQHAIIPTLIFNTDKVLPLNKSFYFWPQRMEMHFLPPVPAGDSVKDLKEKVFAIMWEYYRSTANF